MPDAKRRAVELEPMPDAQELLAAREQGMTWRAWVDAGKPRRSAAIKSPRGDTLAGVRPCAPYRSKWELDYAWYLDAQQKAGQIGTWEYEPDSLEIGVDAHYTPDFRVKTGSRIEYREVKGYRREAAIVRIKAAALRYPQFRFVLVTKLNGDWKHTTIGPKP